MALPKNIAELVEELRKICERKEPDKTEKKEISLIALKELRRLYDHISRNYDGLRLKTLALIAGEVAIISFIFSNASGNGAGNVPLMPTTNYGEVFFWVGTALVALSFVMFILVILPVEWVIPLDLKEIEKLHQRHKSMESFLDYIIDDYVDSIKHCLSKVKERTTRFNGAIYCLLIGVIILLVLKFRG